MRGFFFGVLLSLFLKMIKPDYYDFWGMIQLKLGSVSFDRSILKKSNIGLWAVEMDENCPWRLYLDSDFFAGNPLSADSPEELYLVWKSHINKDYQAGIYDIFGRAVAGSNIIYDFLWNISEKENVFVTLTGMRNNAYEKGIRLEGFYRYISGSEYYEHENQAEYEAVINSLASDCKLIMKINLDNGGQKRFKSNDMYDSHYNKDHISDNYVQKNKNFMNSILAMQEKAGFFDRFTPDKLKKIFETTDSYSANYKIRMDNEDRYMQMKFQKYYTQKGEKSAILTVRDVTEENRDQMKLLRDMGVISALSEEYLYVTYLEVETRDEFLIKSPERDFYIKDEFRNASYDERVKYIAYHFLLPDDREEFLLKNSEQYVLEKLKNAESFQLYFRTTRGNEVHHNQLKYVPIMENGKLVGITIGYRIIDDEYNKEVIYDEEHKIFRKIADSYNSVHYIDFKREYLRTYYVMQQNGYENEVDRTIGNESNYNKFINTYVDMFVAPEDRDRITYCVKPSTVIEKLQTQNRFSFSFTEVMNGVRSVKRIDYIKISGDGTCAVCCVSDITEMIENEKMIQRKIESNLKAIEGLANEYDTLHFLDLETDEYLLYFISQSAMEGALDSVDENAGFYSSHRKLIEEYCHPDYKEEMLRYCSKEYIVELMKNKMKNVSRFLFNNHNEYRWFDFVIIKIEDNDDIPARLAIGYVDVNEEVRESMIKEKELHEALHAAQQANIAKTTFLNNMSHDIRTPMNAIIGFSELAINHSDNSDTVVNYLKKIRQSSNHLMSLINDILDMSKIESGNLYIDSKRENISDIVHTMKEIVLHDISRKHMEFITDCSNIKNEYIFCDKLRLNQVLINIMSNAVKYTPEYGRIIFEVSQIELESDDFATFDFMIKDNGIGMNAEFLKSIYEPFTRVHSSTISGIQGTGLGMAITKNIVDMMDGTITINSAEGKGTEVRVRLSFKISESEDNEKLVRFFKNHRGLVVDDNYDNCINESEILKRSGLDTEWCTSGSEAVNLILDAKRSGKLYDIYFIDMVMPGMSGFDTTRKIRELAGKDVYIYIISAYDWTEIEKEAYEAGVTGFISKPLFNTDLKIIFDKLNGTLEHESDGCSQSFKGKKILLVEDNMLNREIATEVLKMAGFEVSTAEDGTVAVEIMKNASDGDFDIILMDVQMPKMDGYTASKYIRQIKNEYAKRVPIIALTANAFEEDKEAAIQSGMNGHVSKPLEPDELFSVIRSFL